jgi:hypothetical protein
MVNDQARSCAKDALGAASANWLAQHIVCALKEEPAQNQNEKTLSQRRA